MECDWLKESLFGGQTSNGFKLGTVLTLGWFWVRIAGCSLLYRGESMETIDFANILAAENADATEMSPPNYVEHNNSSTYFYIIRRANSCGCQEYTLSAAVKVSIDADGNLAGPRPNDVFAVRAEQVNGNKIKLVWYYCPLKQEQTPASFRIYGDGGTGQIDYENPITVILYMGRKFYSYRSDELAGDRYLFCIRTEGSDGAESASAKIEVQLDTCNPAAVDILNLESI